MKKSLVKLYHLIQKILAPKYCLSCLESKNQYLCTTCIEKINFHLAMQCFKCNKRIDKQCSTIDHRHPIKMHIYFGHYENEILKRIILSGKNNAAQIIFDLGLIIGKELLQRQTLDFNNYHLIPVPISQKKLLHRGFNQTNILAQAIKQITSMPIADILIKIKDTPDQVGLNFKERLTNLKNSFNLISNPPKNIILIDDIKTTGATLQECAYTLKQAGAKNIIALTIT